MTFDELKKAALNLTRAGVSKAKDLSEAAKLRLSNVAEEENIKQAYQDIGKQYVSTHQDAPEAEYTVFFRRITEALAKIKANNEALDKLKEAEEHPEVHFTGESEPGCCCGGETEKTEPTETATEADFDDRDGQ